MGGVNHLVRGTASGCGMLGICNNMCVASYIFIGICIASTGYNNIRSHYKDRIKYAVEKVCIHKTPTYFTKLCDSPK